MKPRRIAAAVLLILVACKPQPTRPAPSPAEPQVKATVVTITTVLQPAARTFTHTLVIAGDRARSGDELDRWRLFDLGKNEVTFVDDVAKTYRRAWLKSLLDDRRDADAQPLPDTLPRAQFTVTQDKRTFLGIEAKQSVVQLGAYRRQLWIGTHPLIPQGLFAMMEASRPASAPAAGVMRAVDAALFDVRGFPLAEHAELPYDKEKMILDRTVVKVEQKNVPQSFLTIGSGYRDLTPVPKAPAARPQPAS